MTEIKHDGLPVAGYKPQGDGAVQAVNINKAIEELILRVLDMLAEDDAVDKRWLAVGRTQIEQGFMAVNRSVFKPGRLGDEAVDDGLKAGDALLNPQDAE